MAAISYKRNYRAVCFTLWTDKLPAGFTMPTALPDGMRVLVYQTEIAPTTGRLHVQVRARSATSS